MATDKHIKGNHIGTSETDKGDENFNSEKDPAGTDPNRYKYISSGIDEEEDDKRAATEGRISKKPKNHTTPEERMLKTNRGEKGDK